MKLAQGLLNYETGALDYGVVTRIVYNSGTYVLPFCAIY